MSNVTQLNSRTEQKQETTTKKVKNLSKSELRDLKYQIMENKIPHRARTNQYLPIPTIEVLEIAKEMGFVEFSVDEMRIPRTRNFEDALNCIHTLTLINPFLKADGISDKEMKIGLRIINSTNGLHRLLFRPFINRPYCDNGLDLPIFESSVSFLHRAGVSSESKIEKKEKIMAAIKDVMDAFNEEIIDSITEMLKFELTRDQQVEFAKQALDLRLSSTKGYNAEETIKSEYHLSLLKNWAAEKNIEDADKDDGNSVWVVFNRIQRNLDLNYNKGPSEVMYVIDKTDSEGKEFLGERKLSALRNFKEVIRINSELMGLAMKFLALAKEDKQNINIDERQAA